MNLCHLLFINNYSLWFCVLTMVLCSNNALGGKGIFIRVEYCYTHFNLEFVKSEDGNVQNTNHIVDCVVFCGG